MLGVLAGRVTATVAIAAAIVALCAGPAAAAGTPPTTQATGVREADPDRSRRVPRQPQARHRAGADRARTRGRAAIRPRPVGARAVVGQRQGVQDRPSADPAGAGRTQRSVHRVGLQPKGRAGHGPGRAHAQCRPRRPTRPPHVHRARPERLVRLDGPVRAADPAAARRAPFLHSSDRRVRLGHRAGRSTRTTGCSTGALTRRSTAARSATCSTGSDSSRFASRRTAGTPRATCRSSCSRSPTAQRSSRSTRSARASRRRRRSSATSTSTRRCRATCPTGCTSRTSSSAATPSTATTRPLTTPRATGACASRSRTRSRSTTGSRRQLGRHVLPVVVDADAGESAPGSRVRPRTRPAPGSSAIHGRPMGCSTWTTAENGEVSVLAASSMNRRGWECLCVIALGAALVFAPRPARSADARTRRPSGRARTSRTTSRRARSTRARPV